MSGWLYLSSPQYSHAPVFVLTCPCFFDYIPFSVLMCLYFFANMPFFSLDVPLLLCQHNFFLSGYAPTSLPTYIFFCLDMPLLLCQCAFFSLDVPLLLSCHALPLSSHAPVFIFTCHCPHFHIPLFPSLCTLASILSHFSTCLFCLTLPLLTRTPFS